MILDIIIPVYGARDDLARCLASVAAHTDLARHRVILVIDGPQDVPSFPNALVLQNEKRLGYAASVNRGMRASSTDVVLLNSDTIVTARWIEKLIEAAYSDEKVGTVTPLSNNATLVSVPRAFEDNLIPTGYDVDSYAKHIEETSKREYPRLPTGVGFCLYIRRALIDDVGLFDEKRFAGGYGEENDFCWRALNRGWLNIADDATFIYHAGHRSFGASRKRALRRAARLLPRAYWKAIEQHMAARQPGNRATRQHVVHLVHGWPPFQHAGTELYAYWLAHRQRETHHVSVYTRSADPQREEGETFELDDRGIRVRFMTNHFTARNPLRRNAIRDAHIEKDFERFLREEKPDLLHVHHLAGHTFSLTRVAKRLGIPIVMQLQDWWSLCARVNLYHRDGNRCTGPTPEKCNACATLTKLPPQPITNRLMHALRRRAARKALRDANAYIAGSNAIRNDYINIVEAPIHVLPYGVSVSVGRRRPRRREPNPIRFGYVGTISPHKGLHTANEAMKDIDNATLHVWGDPTTYPAYAKTLTNAKLEGTFAEEEKQRIYESMDVLLVPSIGLESFGLAAREAMACGVPVIATTGGALDEMSAEFFPPGDVAALRAIIERVIADPTIIDRWRERIREPKREEAHAEEIAEVYRSVLNR